VKHRKDVYDNLDRYAYRVNRVTGGIEVVDLEPVGDSIVGRVVPSEPVVQQASPLFGAFSDEQLVRLGVAEPLLPQIRNLTSEAELLELLDRAPQLTTDVLFPLYEGNSFDYGSVRQICRVMLRRSGLQAYGIRLSPPLAGSGGDAGARGLQSPAGSASPDSLAPHGVSCRH